MPNAMIGFEPHLSYDRVRDGAGFVEPHSPHSPLDKAELVAYGMGQLAIISSRHINDAFEHIDSIDWPFVRAGYMHEQSDLNEAVMANIMGDRG